MTPISDSTRPLPVRRRAAAARLAAAAIALAAVAHAPLAAADAPPAPPESPAVALDAVVISATRTPQEVGTLPSSVSRLTLPQLDAAQIGDLATALDRVAGVSVTTTGATGGPTSLFLRGASSHQVLFMVDGVRMNDRSAAYYEFLGGSDLAGFDRIEILRGPQSTLYGSSAMGGVILLETAHGAGPAHGTLTASAGSFATVGGSVALAGGDERVDYGTSLSHLRTDNDRPRNAFDRWSASARLEARVADGWRVGFTARALRGDYAEPGSRLFPSAADVQARNRLLTAFADWTGKAGWHSRLTLGRHDRDYRYADDLGYESHSTNARDVIDWQLSWHSSPGLELLAGANAEWSRYTIAPSRTHDRVLAEFVSFVARPLPALVLTGGLRHDAFKSAGGAVTGRAGAAWLLDDGRTRLRTTYGTGFSAPGSDDRYGVPQWGLLPNPVLRPERSRGWDVGIDRTFAAGRASVGLTWFENRFRDLFEFEIADPARFTGYTVNRAHATTRGAEVDVQAQPFAAVTLHASYTWLQAINRDTGAWLDRRPRHTADLGVHAALSRQWSLGVGMHLVAKRRESNQALEDYTTARVHVSYAPRPHLTLRLRVENALDEQYEEVLGYPALPRAAYGSLTWSF